MEDKYTNFIKDKDVVFVGACPNLVGKNYGRNIDTYDIVVKSNHSWTFNNPVYNRDYGSHCDVVYINRQYYREMKPFPVREMKERGIKWLCMKGCSEEDKQVYEKSVNVRTIKHVFNEVQAEVKSANMGAFTVFDLLQHSPRNLYITGIDFFASKKPEFQHNNYQEYLDCYLPNKIREQGNKINKGKKIDGHDFIGNAKYFFNLFKKHPNLKTDDFILDLLYSIINGHIKQGEINWN